MLLHNDFKIISRKGTELCFRRRDVSVERGCSFFARGTRFIGFLEGVAVERIERYRCFHRKKCGKQHFFVVKSVANNIFSL